MIDNLTGGLILSFLVFLLVYFLFKKYVLYLILNNSGKEGVPAYELDLESK